MNEQQPPYLITQRSLILDVVNRWEYQYGTRTSERDKRAILNKLKTLDLKTATAEQVNSIIGNDSWTTMRCDQCNRYNLPVIVVGAPSDYESPTATLCRTCFDAASKCWQGIQP